MARFIPGVLSCRGWRMKAEISRGSHPLRLTLSADDGLSSGAAAPKDFDSSVERSFALAWGGEPREGWSLSRESEVLHSGQHCFFPDFVLLHQSGRRVFLEIAGFWTQAYFEQKRKTLELFADREIILAVRARNAGHFLGLGVRLLELRKALSVESVLAALRETTR